MQSLGDKGAKSPCDAKSHYVVRNGLFSARISERKKECIRMHKKKRKERSFSFLSDAYQAAGELEQGLSIKVLWGTLSIAVKMTLLHQLLTELSAVRQDSRGLLLSGSGE